MKTVLVDDMLLDLKLFELKTADIPEIEIVGKFTDGMQAIEYAKQHTVDFAMLDIDMPGMNGIELANRLREIRKDIIIVFATAHTRYAVEALKIKADYIIFKPYDEADIADVVERAKLFRRRQQKRYYFNTFGKFDLMIDGNPVKFRSSKAKELMALCVYFRGAEVSIHDMIGKLWGEEGTATPDNTGYRRTIKELTDTMKDYGAEELLKRKRGSLQLRTELADSDLEEFMKGNAEAVCKFQGCYMQQYSWAEPAIFELEERKQYFLKQHNMSGEGSDADWQS